MQSGCARDSVGRAIPAMVTRFYGQPMGTESSAGTESTRIRQSPWDSVAGCLTPCASRVSEDAANGGGVIGCEECGIPAFPGARQAEINIVATTARDRSAHPTTGRNLVENGEMAQLPHRR